MRLAGLVGCAMLAAVVAGCGNDSGSPKPAAPAAAPAAPTPSVGSNGGQTQIALIPPSHMTEEWKAIHAGAAKAISEVKKGADGKPIMDILWRPADAGTDKTSQGAVARKLIDDGIAAIVITPDSAEALTDVTSAAGAKRVPVIAVNSAFGAEGCKSAISSDDAKAGELAAQTLAKSMDGKGRVLILPGSRDSTADKARVEAFNSSLAAFADLHSTVWENTSPGKDKAPDADGIFAPDESSALSALRLLEQNKLAGKMKVVAIGGSAKLAEALKSKAIDALVLIDPAGEGYLAVKTAGDCIREKKVEKSLLVPLHVATAENMGEAEIAPLLNPPVGE